MSQDLINALKESINVSELNVVEIPTFAEWSKNIKFSSNGIKLYKGKELSNDELISAYKKEIL